MASDQITHQIAVLFSESSWRAHVESAQAAGEVYVCRGGDGRTVRWLSLDREATPRASVQWLRGARGYLGPSGAQALLQRVGLGAEIVRESDLASAPADERASLASYDWLVVADAVALERRTIDAIAGWLGPSKRLVVCGATNLPSELLGASERRPWTPAGAVTLRGVETEPRGVSQRPWSLPGFPTERVRAAAGATVWADAVDAGASADAAPAPGIVVSGRVLWLIPPLFGCAGALLQGQADLGPWRQRLGTESDWYLDEMARALETMLRRWASDAALWDCRPQPWGEHPSALVLRHDTDGSPDASYLEYERAEGVAATYPVLDQEDAAWWVRRLADDPARELALHYRTNEEPLHRWARLWRRPDRIDPSAMGEVGLLRQYRQAQRRFGRPIATLHRHYQFFLYPEIWLALEYLAAAEPTLVGASSLSRWALHAYQGNAARRHAPSAAVPYPRASVSLWTPFHPVVATAEAWRPLPLWESGSLIEPQPEQVDSCVEHAERLPGGLYTVVYHPAHARRGPYRAEGHDVWFRHAVEQARRRGWLIATYETACRTARAWEAARWRVKRVERVGGVGGDRLIVANPTTAPIGPLTFRLREGLTAVAGGATGWEPRASERCVVPSLAPGETRSIRLQRIGVRDVAGVV